MLGRRAPLPCALLDGPSRPLLQASGGDVTQLSRGRSSGPAWPWGLAGLTVPWPLVV